MAKNIKIHLLKAVFNHNPKKHIMKGISTIYRHSTEAETYEQQVFLTAPLQEKVLSFDYIDKAAQGDENFRQEILLQFIVQLPASLSKIENAINNNESLALRSIIHEMKTTVFVMGFGDLVIPPLKKIEAMVQKATDITLVRPVYNYVKKICNCAVEEARLYIR